MRCSGQSGPTPGGPAKPSTPSTATCCTCAPSCSKRPVTSSLQPSAQGQPSRLHMHCCTSSLTPVAKLWEPRPLVASLHCNWCGVGCEISIQVTHRAHCCGCLTQYLTEGWLVPKDCEVDASRHSLPFTAADFSIQLLTPTPQALEDHTGVST